MTSSSRMASTSSVLEGNFYFKTDANGLIDKSRVVCHHCQKEFAYHKSSSSLKYHLKAKHGMFEYSLESPGGTKSDSSCAFESSSKWWPQQNVGYPNFPDVRIESDNLSACLAEWIAKDCRPLNICEDAGLAGLLKCATSNPNLQIPSQQIVGLKIDELYSDLKMTIFQQLSEARHVSLTVDHWLSVEGLSNLCLTAHFVSSWSFQSVTLGIDYTPDQFSIDFVANRINLACTQWGILEKIVLIGTNDTGDVASAITHMNRTTMPCTAMILQSAIDKSIQDCGVEDLLTKVRRLVTYLNHPSVKPEIDLEAEPVHAGLRCLVQDIPNKWGSVLVMINNFLRNKESVLLVLNRQLYDPDFPLVSEGDWEKLSNMASLLGPCLKSLEMLGGSKFVPCSIVFPLLAHLIAGSKVVDNDPAYVVRYKDSFVHELRALQAALMEKDFLKLATVLDPRFKSLKCFKKEERDGIWELAKRELHSQYKNTNPPPAKKAKTMLMYDESSSEEETSGEPGFLNVSLSLTLYKVEASIGDDQCPLHWWAQHVDKYPLLSKVAERVLGIPATMVPSDSLFSPAGDIIAQKRASLMPENINKLSCLTSWMNK